MFRKKIETSQSAVEFALVLPILLIIIFGMIEMGHLIFVYGSVLNASREAARYGAASGTVGGLPQYEDCSGIKNAAFKLRFLANFSVDDVIVMYDTGPSTTPFGPCASTVNYSSFEDGGHRVVVTVSAPYNFILPLIPIKPFTIVSTSRRSILGSVSIAGTVVAPPAGSPPTMSQITPNIGPSTGGTVVTINGANLTGGSVYFGGTLANCTPLSSTLTSCTTPAHAAGVVNVVLTTTSGTATLTNAFTYIVSTYTPTPSPTPTDTTTPTATFTPLYTATITRTPTITATFTPTSTVTQTPTKTATPTVTSTAVCGLVMYTTPTPPPTMLATSTPVINPTQAALANTLLFTKTIYNTNPSAVQVNSITLTYLDKTNQAPLYRILETTIYPNNGGSASDIIAPTYRIMNYTNLFIPAGGSVTFYVYYHNTNTSGGKVEITTLPGDLTSVSIDIANYLKCTK